MSPAFGSPLEPVREGGAVTYISQVDAVETSNGVSPATVRVSWQIGDQNPALVEVYVKPASAGPTGIGTMVGRVAVGAGQPSDVSIQLPAPSWYAFLVAPRLLDAQGDPKDQMADAAGDDQYWENFVAEADLYVVGAPTGKPPGGPAVPQITGVTKSKGRFVVDWQIAKLPDHYNVRIDAPGDSRAQVEIPGGWTSYGVDLVEPARTYVFSIQACDRSVWGNSTCSAWVSTEIPIDAAGGWETNDVPVDAGGHLAAATQADRQIDLFVFDKRPELFAALGPTQWRGWLALSAVGAAPAGAPLAAIHQPPNDQLTLLYVGNGGRLVVSWVAGTQPWQGAIPIGTDRFAPPGAHVGVAVQPPNPQLTALVIGDDEAVHVSWEVDNGRWSVPVPISQPKTAPAGAPVVVVHQPPNDQLDALVVGNDGSILLLWEADNGAWQGPAPIAPPGFAPSGGHLAAARQPPNDQLDVFVVGNDGAVAVCWEVDNGPWKGPAAITPAGFAPAGAPVAAIRQGPQDQLDVFVVGVDGRLYVLWEVNNGPWQGPAPISDAVCMPGADVAVVGWPAGDLRVYVPMKSGHILQALVSGAGAWTSKKII